MIGFVYGVFNYEGDLLNSYFDGFIKFGKLIESKSGVQKSVYRFVSDYYVFGLNCIILSLDVVR